MKSILVKVDEELHTRMKMQAAEQKTTVKGYVTAAIAHAVEKGEKKA